MNAWLLLRGLTREARHWGPFPAALSDRFPRMPVVTIDLPGNGERHAERSPPDMPEIALACRQRASALGLRPPFGVLAMSLGAMATAEWARACPQDLACAVLISASLRPFSPAHRRLRPSAWASLLRAAIAPDPAQREREVWHITSRRPERDREDVVGTWAALRRDRPVTAGNTLRQLWAAARYRAPPEAPAVPLLLLSGKGDRLVHPSCSAAIAREWGAPLHTHPWAGHDVPLDDPAWVADAVAAWVQTLHAR